MVEDKKHFSMFFGRYITTPYSQKYNITSTQDSSDDPKYHKNIKSKVTKEIKRTITLRKKG
jgi:hypothetical protein